MVSCLYDILRCSWSVVMKLVLWSLVGKVAGPSSSSSCYIYYTCMIIKYLEPLLNCQFCLKFWCCGYTWNILLRGHSQTGCIMLNVYAHCHIVPFRVLCAVQSVVCHQDSTSKPLVIPLYVILLLNAETVKRTPTPLFSTLARCFTHGPFFGRLRYMESRYIVGQFSVFTTSVGVAALAPIMLVDLYERIQCCHVVCSHFCI